MDSNKINEYLQYLKENNQQDSISDYFTKYIPSESISETNLLTFKTPELKVNDLFKTSNPIINNKDYRPYGLKRWSNLEEPKSSRARPLEEYC